MKDVQKAVQEAVDQLIESGAETGLQVAVYRQGEMVVDVVAGLADPDTGRPGTADTLFFGVSAGKGITSTLAHVLAERGALDYDTPIAELWPEFAAHGKDRATVRHALTHEVGVPAVPADTTPEDLADWQKMTATIADSEPWWEPGTKNGYHALTYGYIVGEIVRRASGKELSRVLDEELATPLGVRGELYFGVPESELGRVARLVEVPQEAAPAFELPADHPMMRVAPAAVQPSAELYNRRDFLTADVPSGGTMTVRAIAHMYAALIGEVDGVRLVSPKCLELISSVAVADVDQIFQFPAPKSLGYSIGRFDPAPATPPTEFGWGGMIGTHADADPATGVTFALMKNRYTAGDFGAAMIITGVVSEALGK